MLVMGCDCLWFKMVEDSGEKIFFISKKFEDFEEELMGCGVIVCCDLRRNFYWYFVFGLICFLSFGKWMFVSFSLFLVDVR